MSALGLCLYRRLAGQERDSGGPCSAGICCSLLYSAMGLLVRGLGKSCFVWCDTVGIRFFVLPGVCAARAHGGQASGHCNQGCSRY
eukprot:scaffold7092_cov262-Pinguiococcus_pyrenoidosus.AAC.2